jgi:uncharacterized protein YqgV (UPF0045/DUF77 family)
MSIEADLQAQINALSRRVRDLEKTIEDIESRTKTVAASTVVVEGDGEDLAHAIQRLHRQGRLP